MSNFINVSVIQTVPPANLNRDESGSPKTARFGGTLRQRLSNQSQRHAMRDWLQDEGVVVGSRSRIWPITVGQLLLKTGLEPFAAFEATVATTTHVLNLKPAEASEDKANKADDIRKAVAAAWISNGLSELPDEEMTAEEVSNIAEEMAAGERLDNEGETSDPKSKAKAEAKRIASKIALAFYSPQQLLAMAETAYVIATETLTDAEIAKVRASLLVRLGEQNTVDMAGFGRMMASRPNLTIEAAMHGPVAYGTTVFYPETDYVTAMDDLVGVGAAMLTLIEFGSSTFYRYGSINVKQLIANLGEEGYVAAVEEALRYLLESFVYTLPDGKISTFAHQTYPHAVLVTLNKSEANLFNAFATPVVGSSAKTEAEAATERMVGYAESLVQMYPRLAPSFTMLVQMGDGQSVDDMIAATLAALRSK